MVAFDSLTLLLTVVFGLVVYPFGIVVMDYFGQTYNYMYSDVGNANEQVVDSFNIIFYGWQCEPIITVLGALLSSVVVGQVRRAGG